jgi:methyl-accepting chemotaxis protein
VKNHSGKMAAKAVSTACVVVLATAAAATAVVLAVGSLAFSIPVGEAAALAGITLLVGVVCFVLLRSRLKKILRPLEQMELAAESAAPNLPAAEAVAAAAAKLGKGGTDAEIAMADAVWLLREIGEGRYQAKSRCPEKYTDAYAPLLPAIYAVSGHLNDTVQTISAKIEELTGGMNRMSTNTQVLSRENQSENETVEEITVAMNDIATVLEHSAGLRDSARQLFRDSADGFTTCNGKMSEMMAAMEEISTKTAGIGKVIKTIDDLAFQTNILALNAAVEAARAGNAGKGFSVVADEVRSLAMKSAQAAQDSGAMVTEAVRAVENGSNLAKATAEALQFINENSQKVTAITNEIGKDSQAQTEGIQRVSVGLDQIVSAVQSSTTAAQESASMEQEVNQKAEELREEVASLITAG